MYEKKKASASTLAERNTTQAKSYHRYFGKSRIILKMRIGKVLLCLVAGQVGPDGWQVFDRLLRQLYEGGTI
jgi:hypothetical protein